MSASLKLFNRNSSRQALCHSFISLFGTAEKDSSRTFWATQPSEVSNQVEIWFLPPPSMQWLTPMFAKVSSLHFWWGAQHSPALCDAGVFNKVPCPLPSFADLSGQHLSYCHIQQWASTCSLRNTQLTHASAPLHPLLLKIHSASPQEVCKFFLHLTLNCLSSLLTTWAELKKNQLGLSWEHREIKPALKQLQNGKSRSQWDF